MSTSLIIFTCSFSSLALHSFPTRRSSDLILTTEGVAMQFERFSKSRAWLEKMGVKVEDAKAFDEAAAKVQRNQLLIFSRWRSEEHTSELQSHSDLVCRLLLEKKNIMMQYN